MTHDEKILRTMDRYETYVPSHMREGLLLYINRGISPGSFMSSVLCNDLKGAAARADRVNRANIVNIVEWLRTYAPTECWGDPEAVETWRGINNSPESKEGGDEVPHAVLREEIQWFTWSEDSDSEFKFVSIMDLETKHLKCILEDCTTMSDVERHTIQQELKDRLIEEV